MHEFEIGTKSQVIGWLICPLPCPPAFLMVQYTTEKKCIENSRKEEDRIKENRRV